MLGPNQGSSEPDNETNRGRQAAHAAHEDTKTHGLQGWYLYLKKGWYHRVALYIFNIYIYIELACTQSIPAIRVYRELTSIGKVA